ncbi:MAG: O-antigen polymerase [Paraclostridium bifermentans]
MELLFSIIIFVQLLIAIIILKETLHPLIILKGVVFLGSIGLLIFHEAWGINISAATVFILSSAIIWVDLGFVFTMMITKISNRENLYLKNNKNLKNKKHEQKMLNISTNKAILSTILILITIIVYLSIGSDYIVGSNNIKEFTRNLMIYKGETRSNGAVNLGIWTYILLVCRMLGVVYLSFAVKEYMTSGWSKKVSILLMPSIAVFIMGYILGIRSILVIYSLIIVFVAYKIQVKSDKYENGRDKKRLEIKYFIMGILCIGLIFSYFFIAGKLAGKIDPNEGLNNIAIYLSGGIGAFDNVYKNLTFTSDLFGQQTFRIIYKAFNLIPLFDFETQNTISTTIYGTGGFRTNVYTANLNFMADFGYMGVILCNMLIGMFHGFLYNKSKNEIDAGVWTVLNAFFMMPLVSYLNAEKYFAAMPLNAIYFIAIYLLIKLPILYKRRIR